MDDCRRFAHGNRPETSLSKSARTLIPSPLFRGIAPAHLEFIHKSQFDVDVGNFPIYEIAT